jgi:uncharacterized OsmC-like protein
MSCPNVGKALPSVQRADRRQCRLAQRPPNLTARPGEAPVAVGHLAGRDADTTIGRVDAAPEIEMSLTDIATALQRVERAFTRRPDAGMHDDVPATAHWQGGARFIASHPDGHQVSTDMPPDIGGTGSAVTPGWLFRAGLASCAATSITMAVAAAGIALELLEVRASSRSDTRGLLGMPGADGTPVAAGPHDVQLHVRIVARGIEPARLRALVQEAVGRSPVPSVLPNPMPMALHIDTGDRADA